MNLIKRCSNCNQELSINQFNKDKYGKDGLSSACRNCNKKRATQWRKEKKVGNRNTEVELEQLKQSYEMYIEELGIITREEYEKHKGECKEFAFSMVPSLKQPYEDYLRLFSGEKIRQPQTDSERLGARVNTVLNSILRYKFPKDKSKDNGRSNHLPNRRTKINRSPTAKDAVISWIESGNNFIPDDTILAHFYGDITPAAFYYPRRELEKEGYEFKKVDNGWVVKKRPKSNEKPTLDNMSKDELISLIKKLVE